MRLEVLKFLYDVRKAAGALTQFVAGRTLDDYESDLMLRSAVERQFTIVGEALNRAKKIDPAAVSTITALPKIIGFRNILVHGYDVIEGQEVWRIFERDLPTLIEEVDELLRRGDAELAATDPS